MLETNMMCKPGGNIPVAVLSNLKTRGPITRLLYHSFVATSGPGSSYQPEGSSRCLDEGRHHP